MEPEQERLSKLYSGSGIHSLPELNPKQSYRPQYQYRHKQRKDRKHR